MRWEENDPLLGPISYDGHASSVRVDGGRSLKPVRMSIFIRCDPHPQNGRPWSTCVSPESITQAAGRIASYMKDYPPSTRWLFTVALSYDDVLAYLTRNQNDYVTTTYGPGSMPIDAVHNTSVTLSAIGGEVRVSNDTTHKRCQEIVLELRRQVNTLMGFENYAEKRTAKQVKEFLMRGGRELDRERDAINQHMAFRKKYDTQSEHVTSEMLRAVVRFDDLRQRVNTLTDEEATDFFSLLAMRDRNKKKWTVAMILRHDEITKNRKDRIARGPVPANRVPEVDETPYTMI